MTEAGLLLPNGCRITHGAGATIKRPLPDLDLVMHELSAANEVGFRGQLGFIPFRTDFRLPRHIHMSDGSDGPRRLLAERILTLDGVALVELAGEIFVVAPGTLVDIPGGVPHTWTACPAGVRLPDGTASDGRFLMIYEYAEPTGFFTTPRIEPVADPDAYVGYREGETPILIPALSAQEVAAGCAYVWDRALRRDLALVA